jgi:predicted AAA+ superfamily ATPase
MESLIPRHRRNAVLEALRDTRVVMILGARQVGKSTLGEEIVRHDHPAQIVNLDDQVPREAALADPDGFIAGLKTPVMIDEAQRGGPELLLAIKASVDRDKRPGRFLLTGSANLLASRRAYDVLTGRVEAIHLWPLAQSEIECSHANFVDALFNGEPPQIAGAQPGREAFASRLAAGGYPEALERSQRRRDNWFRSYLDTTLEGDLGDISEAHKLEEMPRLLRALAARAANLLTYRELARDLALDHKTVKGYIRLLEMIYLVKVLPAWRPGLASREISSPKVHLVDSGLLLHLLGANEHRLADDPQVTGKAFENFVGMEVLKHADWAETDSRAYHYRHGRKEIDLVLESRSGDLVCVESKAGASISRQDWSSIAELRDRTQGRFSAGAVVYSGESTVPLGDRIWAVPVSGLWDPGA